MVDTLHNFTSPCLGNYSHSVARFPPRTNCHHFIPNLMLHSQDRCSLKPEDTAIGGDRQPDATQASQILAEGALAFRLASGPADLGVPFANLGVSSAALAESSPPFVSSPAAEIQQEDQDFEVVNNKKTIKSSNMLGRYQVLWCIKGSFR